MRVTSVEIEDDVNEEKTVNYAVERQPACVYVCISMCV